MLKRPYLSLFVLILFSGCAALQPFVSDINLISIQQEKELSSKIQSQIGTEMKLLQDASVTQKVRSIGEKLAKELPSREFDYQFYVVNDKTPNAFTVPGGAIYVHTGLVQFVDNEDQLAGVIAHEIGHAYERHPTKSMTRAYGFNYLKQLLLPENTQAIQNVAFNLAQGGILTKYGRDDEREADEIGFLLLQRSGYKVSGLSSFLLKIQSLEKGPTIPFLNTHPPTPERIERLKKFESNPGSVTFILSPTN